MKSKRLLAAITASGAVLLLNVSADAHNAGIRDEALRDSETKPLVLRVEQLREKLQSLSPVAEHGTVGQRIDNVVQFFNFLNSSREKKKRKS